MRRVSALFLLLAIFVIGSLAWSNSRSLADELIGPYSGSSYLPPGVTEEEAKAILYSPFDASWIDSSQRSQHNKASIAKYYIYHQISRNGCTPEELNDMARAFWHRTKEGLKYAYSESATAAQKYPEGITNREILIQATYGAYGGSAYYLPTLHLSGYIICEKIDKESIYFEDYYTTDDGEGPMIAEGLWFMPGRIFYQRYDSSGESAISEYCLSSTEPSSKPTEEECIKMLELFFYKERSGENWESVLSGYLQRNLAGSQSSITQAFSPAKNIETTYAEDEWQQAYADFLMSGKYLSAAEYYPDVANDYNPIVYALHDIDANGLPELLIYNGCDYHAANGTHVFYLDEIVKYSGTIWGGPNADDLIRLLSNHKYPGVLLLNGGGGYYEDSYFTIKQGELTEELICISEFDPYWSENLVETRVTEDDGLYFASQDRNELKFFTTSEILARLEDSFSILPESPVITLNSGLIESFEMMLDWGDDRFSRDATVYYDNELSIAALALSGAAETTPGVEGEACVSEMLGQLGLEKVNSFWYASRYMEADTVACSFASKTILVDGEHCNLIVIVNRGSVGSFFDNWSWLDFDWKNDWKSNLGGASSFRNAASKVHGYLQAYIENAQIDTNLRTKLFITGHSRGGAVANILGTLVDDIAKQEDVYVYTFASPKTTDTPGEYPNIINILNREDLVPELSPFDEGRYGQDKWFRSDDESLRGDIYRYFSSITNGKDLEATMKGTLWLFDFPRSEFEKIGYAHDTATYMARLMSTNLWIHDTPQRYIETVMFD